MEPPRSTAQRKADTLARLASAVDCWVPSSGAGGDAYLIPLSFVWHEGRIILATLGASSTVRNLRRAGRMRVALDGTRDVVIVAGDIAIMAQDEIDASTADLLPGILRGGGFRATPRGEHLRLHRADATQHPGLARGERTSGSRDHARGAVAGIDTKC